MHNVKIKVMKGIHDENDHLAAHVNMHLTGRQIFAVNLMGAPGIGKTSCLKQLISGIKPLKPYVIEGDIESDLDTQALRTLGITTFQINTFGACHLDAPLVHNAIQNMEFDQKGILFIENIGNLVCPAEFSIGEHIKVLVCSVTEGSDKPYKYPLAFEKAEMILLNKIDLTPHVDFDEDFFAKGLRALNKKAPLFAVSAKTGEGFTKAAAWLKERAEKVEAAYPQHHHHE